ARDVATDRIERVVAAGYELLDHRRELLGARVGVFDLVEGLATESLAAKAQLEADGMLRLDERRQTELLGRVVRFRGATRVVRPRYVDSGGRSFFELGALALNPLEDVPVGERSEHLEIAEVLRDQVELLVVRREHDDLPERSDRRDEPRRVGVRVGAEEPFRVAPAEAERA